MELEQCCGTCNQCPQPKLRGQRLFHSNNEPWLGGASSRTLRHNNAQQIQVGGSLNWSYEWLEKALLIRTYWNRPQLRVTFWSSPAENASECGRLTPWQITPLLCRLGGASLASHHTTSSPAHFLPHYHTSHQPGARGVLLSTRPDLCQHQSSNTSHCPIHSAVWWYWIIECHVCVIINFITGKRASYFNSRN